MVATFGTTNSPTPLALLKQTKVIWAFDEDGNELFDAEALRNDPKTLADVGAQIYRRFAHEDVDFVVGVSEKGLLIASAITRWFITRGHHPTSTIRVDKNPNGEYELEPCLAAAVRNRNVLAVDYRIKTGSTLNAAIQALQKAGAIVVGAGVICLEAEEFRNLGVVPICAVVRIQDGRYVEKKTN